jgi:glycosyltransferase involved in cell wall biosynthesis
VNVLILHAELGTLRGGGENFTRNLFGSFAARGHRVRAAFTADRRGQYPFPLPAGIEPLPVNGVWSRSFAHGAMSAIALRLRKRGSLLRAWESLQHGISWRTIRWYNETFHRRVLELLRMSASESDVIYVHSNPFLAREASRLRPTVLRLPGPVTPVLSPVLHHVHAVCANGDALRSVRSFMGDQVIELPVGLDQELFAPGFSSRRGAIGWGHEHVVVGYVGRLSRIKGVDILAEAFRRVANARPDARLLLVGTGEEEKNLRNILRSEIARGVVYCAGDVSHEQLTDWYRAMDLFVMPSRYENCSNAVLEALACGIPFLGSDVGGNRLLHHTGAAWLFEPGSSASLGNALDAAITDRAELKARGERGRAHVLGRYSWSASAERLEEIAGRIRAGVAAEPR